MLSETYIYANEFEKAIEVYNGISSEYNEAIVQGINRSLPFFRSQLAKRMATRGIPKLHFFYDKTIDESTKISKLLDSVLPPEK